MTSPRFVDRPSPFLSLSFEAGCLQCGGPLAMMTTANPTRREAVAAVQCSTCNRLHACRVFLDIVPTEHRRIG